MANRVEGCGEVVVWYRCIYEQPSYILDRGSSDGDDAEIFSRVPDPNAEAPPFVGLCFLLMVHLRSSIEPGWILFTYPYNKDLTSMGAV